MIEPGTDVVSKGVEKNAPEILHCSRHPNHTSLLADLKREPSDDCILPPLADYKFMKFYEKIFQSLGDFALNSTNPLSLMEIT